MTSYNLEVTSISPLSKKKPRQAVVLCHGYGGDGQDISNLAINWQRFLPETIFLCPNASEICTVNPQGYQWYDLSSDKEEVILEKSLVAEEKLNTFLDQVLDNFQLEVNNLALVGFSQGAMLALHVGLRRKKKCAGIVGYSGMLLDPDNLQNEVESKPPIVLVHGDIDPVITPLSLPKAETKLKNLEIPVETHMREGLGHGIDAEGVEIGKTFLHKNLQS